MKLAEAIALPEGSIIPDLVVRVKRAFPPKSGKSAYGEWRFERLAVEDATDGPGGPEHILVFKNGPPLPDWARQPGAVLRLHSQTFSGGITAGLRVQTEKYKDRETRVVMVTPSAILEEPGTGASSPAWNPPVPAAPAQRAQPSAPVQPVQPPSQTLAPTPPGSRPTQPAQPAQPVQPAQTVGPVQTVSRTTALTRYLDDRVVGMQLVVAAVARILPELDRFFGGGAPREIVQSLIGTLFISADRAGMFIGLAQENPGAVSGPAQAVGPAQAGQAVPDDVPF
jgi:hypothetical protein